MGEEFGQRETTAILVIDVDESNGWRGNLDAMSPQMRKVATHIKALLDAGRAEKKRIIFATWPDSNFRGQEMQLRKGTPSEDLREKISEEASQLMSNGKCIGCDSRHGLAAFLAHQHGECFEPVFIKMENDAFSNRALANYLHDAGIGNLILAGCQTFACICETAVGAVKNGFNVTLLRDCTFSPFSDPAAEQLWLKEVKNRSSSIIQSIILWGCKTKICIE